MNPLNPKKPLLCPSVRTWLIACAHISSQYTTDTKEKIFGCGMLLGVPAASAAYELLKEVTAKRELKSKEPESD